MEKAVKATVWIEEATRVIAGLKDFDGDSQKWNETFYQIWRYQMTWDFAYDIEVHETKSDVFVSMLIRNAYKKNVQDMMESLGYRNVQFWDEHVGIAQTYDIKDPDAEDMYTIVAE